MQSQFPWEIHIFQFSELWLHFVWMNYFDLVYESAFARSLPWIALHVFGHEVTPINSFFPGSKRGTAAARGDIALLYRWCWFFWKGVTSILYVPKTATGSPQMWRMWWKWGFPEIRAGWGCRLVSLALEKKGWGRSLVLSWGRDLELSSQAENFGTFHLWSSG